MAEQYPQNVASGSTSDHEYYGRMCEADTKKKRITSFNDIELQVFENDSDWQLEEDICENAWRTNEVKGGDICSDKICGDILRLLTEKQKDGCFGSQSKLEQGSCEKQKDKKLPSNEQKTHSTEVKQNNSKCFESPKERDSSSSPLRKNISTLTEKETIEHKNPSRSDENSEMNTQTKESRTSERTNVRIAMRVAKEQSRSLLNNLYVEDLLDDLLLFNLLVEHKLTLKKLENMKETLVTQKETQKNEEETWSEIIDQRYENKGFVLDYDVLDEEEYKVWIRRMEARASEQTVKKRSEGNRIPGKVGRPTMWKGCSF